MKILQCSHCGNQVFMLYDAGVPMICCGEEMEELEAQTADSSLEKHVPYVVVDGNVMSVTVGEVIHPMLEAHYIRFIAVKQGDRVQFAYLHPGDEPKATFVIEPGESYAAYEFCNLHGLWKAEGQA